MQQNIESKATTSTKKSFQRRELQAPPPRSNPLPPGPRGPRPPIPSLPTTLPRDPVSNQNTLASTATQSTKLWIAGALFKKDPNQLIKLNAWQGQFIVFFCTLAAMAFLHIKNAIQGEEQNFTKTIATALFTLITLISQLPFKIALEKHENIKQLIDSSFLNHQEFDYDVFDVAIETYLEANVDNGNSNNNIANYLTKAKGLSIGTNNSHNPITKDVIKNALQKWKEDQERENASLCQRLCGY